MLVEPLLNGLVLVLREVEEHDEVRVVPFLLLHGLSGLVFAEEVLFRDVPIQIDRGELRKEVGYCLAKRGQAVSQHE